MDVGNGLVGGGIVGGLVALIWGIKKMLERSSCHSDSGCCKIDIDRMVEEHVRQRTERDADRMIELVIRNLKKENLVEEKSEEPSEAWIRNSV